MDQDEKLKLDYEQTTQYHHNLADIRFRLLALVPIATGAAIALVEKTVSGPHVLAIGLLGFMVTLGITFYDQRNTQIYDAMQKRAKTLEVLLGFLPLDDKTKQRGGAFLDRPDRGRRLFGVFLMWHDRALAVIYAATFAGWSYLITDGLIQTVGKSGGRLVPWARFLIPILTFCLFVRALEEFDDPTDIPDALPFAVREIAYRKMDGERDAAQYADSADAPSLPGADRSL
ncbi:MAG: hypothetical protein HZB33_11265 [Nitrospirae bacterium]|nr:hypothetical protein [Nitrospirota bacterium]